MDIQHVDRAQQAMLDRARDLVRDVATARRLVSQIDNRLRERVSAQVGAKIKTAEQQASQLRQRASQLAPDPAEIWPELHATRCDVDLLLDECLLLINGSATRALRLDDGYCALADALVDELVARTTIDKWKSFTLLGRSDQYARLSRAIQVRFPAGSIWDLSAVAHELGHFVGPALVADAGLTHEHPLDRVFGDFGDGTEKSWSWLQELVSDAFAAHVLGPAYGFGCVVAGFDPLLAFVSTDTHPAAEQRVQLISEMLVTNDDPGVRWAAGRITELWHELVASAGGFEGRAAIGESPYAKPVVKLLEEQLPTSHYQGWSTAEQVAAELGDQTRMNSEPRIADILNGAWLRRLDCTSAAGRDIISQKAVVWCSRVGKVA